jgi:hypothetical protein
MPAEDHAAERVSRLRISPSLVHAVGGVGVAGESVRGDSAVPSRRLLRGSLLEKDSRRERPEAEPLPLSVALPGLEGTARTVTSLFGGRARLVAGANIAGGPYHYSSGVIEEFVREKASTRGKFGPGTYLGVGELGGETVAGLKATGSVKHEVAFTGNILVLPRDEVRAVAAELMARKGILPSGVSINIENAPLTEYVEELDFAGVSVDAVMVYMDAEQSSAEIAVLPAATDRLRILGTE